jgi:hypothetical protein
MQSENTAGAEQTTETPIAEPGIETLSELMADEKTPGGEEQQSGSEEKAVPTKFNDLAGALDMELDALYKLEISQAEDGTPVTIENLKDHYSKQSDVELREIEFEERRTRQESELMQAQEELRELMAALPEKAISPQVLQKVRDKHEAQVQLERKRTMQVIPEWQDEQTRTADIEGMAEHLKQYGYPVNYLERVSDHRQVKYIRDNWQREQRIRKALEKVRAGKPNPVSKQKPASKAPQKQPLAGVKRGNARNQLEAVFSELD